VEKHGTAGQATGDNMIRRIRIACWITKAADIQSEYVIILAFPQQEWLLENASVLRYTYVSCRITRTFHTSRSVTRCSRACH